jgi:hypothetical protein
LKKLWQGCGKNPDFTAKADIIDKFLLNEISNFRVCNISRVHPVYTLIRQFFVLRSFAFISYQLIFPLGSFWLCPKRVQTLLQTFAILHNSPHTVSQLLGNWSVVFLNRINRIPERLCHVVGACHFFDHIDCKGIAKAMSVSVWNISAFPEAEHCN